MSYLNPLRLHFSGSFQADVSTVNNDPTHFDNATFKPEYQERQHGNHLNGWWNPRGSADWRLRGCRVTSAFMRDGRPAAGGDPVLTADVADSAGTAPAKLVDLDSEQQMVSTIWGLEVRIATTGGDTLLAGRFEPAAFTDIWGRSSASGASGDMQAAAMYQSVLTDLWWADVAASPFLRQLREAAGEGMLSIKFNVDSFNMNYQDPRFATGRIVGTIGPAVSSEPRHFVAGRQFLTKAGSSSGFFDPAGQLNFCAGVLDPRTRRLYLDLGNALPTGSGGLLSDLGDLSLSVLSADGTVPVTLGVLPATDYTRPSWYGETAGVAVFPPDRPLTEEEFAQANRSPLVLAGPGGTSGKPAEITEAPGGLFIRADQFVFRLSPGDQQKVPLYATRFGHPHRGAAVFTYPTPEYLQPDTGLPVAVPADAIGYDRRVVTNESGIATLRIEAGDPGTPRNYIDGQVYALYPVLEETLIYGNSYPFDPANFISLLVWSPFQPDEPPTWFGSIQPLLQQYANLYPIMGDFVDLGEYDSVCKYADPLQHVFGLDISDPNSMPVTRDLSPAKRAAILSWLRQPGELGLPRLGTETAGVIPAMRAPAAGERTPSGAFVAGSGGGAGAGGEGGDGAGGADGGKAAAIGRMPAAGRQPADVILAQIRAAQTAEENGS